MKRQFIYISLAAASMLSAFIPQHAMMQRLRKPLAVACAAAVIHKAFQLDEEHQKLGKKDFPTLGVEYRNYVSTSKLPEHYKDFNKVPPREGYEKHHAEHLQKFEAQVNAGYEAPMYLKFIDNTVGHGVFAERDLQEGELIGCYAGDLIKKKQLEPGKGKDFSWEAALGKFRIDAYRAGNFTRFINHSYNANISADYIYSNEQWNLIYFTNRPIKKGQQLFVNYGPGYWKFRGIEPIELNPTIEQILKDPVTKFMSSNDR